MKSKQQKTPWPTKAAMTQVYEQALWGSHISGFYSGDGSHHPELVDPYVGTVSSFLTSFDTPLTVCDLGCGDFNVGQQLVKYAKCYVAVDIVSELIAYNSNHFKADHLEFHCLDLVADDLPSGNCALLRQVLQHLSNAEIHRILPKLSQYNYVILTEHVPYGDFEPNTDLISGQGTRLKQGSGLELMAAPFHLKVRYTKQLLSVKSTDGKGIIVTTLYKFV
ncbi:hypothetical protein SAMN04515667_1888 [Formosa sp. Hel1_31_208]|uniref:class I SAM-dependent methyltransferase n=1 Tax=Formosa sp. Hel1_31_208 TaxID=1798225 RepID=UPI00087A98EA|nr:class I SAM-dependent methyltransferase [Formosa sp. Hel1_31_208]SDS31209.1 hypothetical protein SAMN04515667_1888 [Formosa sp. Hel1_31_208]